MVKLAGNVAGCLRVARVCAIVLGALLALAGCGDDSAGSSEGACAYLSKEDVEEALGGPFRAPERNEGPSGSPVQVCSWYAEPGKDGKGFIQLTVSNFPGKGRAQFDDQRKIAPRPKVITGVGERAFASRFGRNIKVTTLKGDRVIEVLSVDERTATELIKAVLDRV